MTLCIVILGCQKEDYFTTAEEGFITEEAMIGETLEDTLNWLNEAMTGMELAEDWKNEVFASDAIVTDQRVFEVYTAFSNTPITVTAELINGQYVVEGDIILGTEADIRHQESRAATRGSVHSSPNRKWPGGIIPYEIAPGHPITNRILDAIDSLNQRSNLTIRPRTNESDFVRFIFDPSSCSSSVGRIGGMQLIRASQNCSVGNMIHEILHAAGLWHEQSRCDRADFVSILWNNISSGRENNFGQRCATLNTPGPFDRRDGEDIGAYNYGSIMHYGSFAFSANGGRTILPRGSGKADILTKAFSMGQRDQITQGDINTVNRLYPVKANQYYVIQFRHSQKVWDLPRGEKKTGTSITQRTISNGTDYDQQFQFIPQEDGSYRIRSRRSRHSLEIQYGSKKNYRTLRQNNYHGKQYQHFIIENTSGQYFTIKPLHSGKAIQMKSSNMSNGQVVHQYDQNNGFNQQVRFLEI